MPIQEASPMAQWVKNLPANARDTGDVVWFLGLEDPLEEDKATHSSILAWGSPRTEKPGGLQSKGSQRVRSDWHTHACLYQFSSVAQSCPTLWDLMNCSMPGLPVHHQLPEPTQTHVHWVGDAIQPSHPLLSPSPLALNLSRHEGLFRRVSSSHQVAKLLELQLQHQSFQWTPRTDLL